MLEHLGESAGRWPFAPAVQVGNKQFLCGLFPADSDGLLSEACPPAGFPLHYDPLALQSETLLSRFEESLDKMGIESKDLVRLSQWFTGSENWPIGSEWADISITRYMEARERRFGVEVPASIAVAVRRLPVASSLVGLDALASTEQDRESIMPPGEEARAFPAGIRIDDWIHLSGELPTDWKDKDGSAVAPEARVNPTLWYGYPVRSQTEFLLEKLSRIAGSAGSTLSRTVHATVFLPNVRDFVGFEEAWRGWFPEHPPARTIIPGTGLACRGCRVEVALDLMTSETPELVFPERLPSQPGYETPGIKAGNLLYISGQMAIGEDGVDPRGLADPALPDLCAPSATQLEIILERIDRICDAAGTSLDNLVQVRVFLSDLSDFGEVLLAWDSAFEDRRPTGTAVGVGPLLVPGCQVLVDAIAYIPERRT